ncbi:hypothetical protein HMPREF9419_2079 [Prevotella nigrescens ATCC 33563]|nr:hypothetical protein HMPREF9419_2079 [Prevotella nigrescens ATCC 33563]
MRFLYKIKARGYGVPGEDMEKRKTKFKAKKQPLRTTNGNVLNLLRQIYTLTKQSDIFFLIRLYYLFWGLCT